MKKEMILLGICFILILRLASAIEVNMSEKVTCRFTGSEKAETCFIDDEENNLSCSGKGICQMIVNGVNDQEVVWKSSCGGYSYTTINAIDEDARFNCMTKDVEAKMLDYYGFKYLYVKCMDKREKKLIDSRCRLARDFMKDAILFCQENCKTNCGVASISLTETCYSDEIDKTLSDPIIYNQNKKIGGLDKMLPDNAKVCKDSCVIANKCYSFNSVKNYKYCSSSGYFVNQLKGGEDCTGDYMCQSNQCIKEKCLGLGFLDKIVVWFRGLFN